MKKILSFCMMSLVAALCVAGLTACGSSSTTTLKTMSMFGGSDSHAETYQELLESFKEEKGIEIEDNSATSDETWKSSVITSFYSGIEPDVLFYFNGATAKPIVTNDYVVSIAEIREEYPDFAKNISETVMDEYCVPIKGFIEGIFVNTELFTGDLAPYAEKDSWTWSEFLTVGEKLIANNIVPVALGAEDEPHYWIEHTVLGMAGGNAAANIPSSAAIDSNSEVATKWVNALKLISEAKTAGMFGASNGERKAEIAKQEFLNGGAAMYLDGSWFAGSITETTTAKASKVKMIPFPTISTDKGGTNKAFMQSGFTSGFYISRKAWNDEAKRDLCVKLVEKMTTTDTITKFCVAGGGVPADSTVVLPNETFLQKSMNTMSTRTVGAVLPLSDSCKAQTFPILVASSSAFLSGDEALIKQALKNFSAAQ